MELSSLHPRPQSFRYLDWIVGIFVTVLLVSNLVGPKVAQIGPFTMGAGIFLFPIDYIFGDVLTEVYGYAYSRRVIWIGFGSALLASVVFFIVDAMPPAAGYHGQEAFHSVLGQFPRIVAASLVAYLIGEFSNSVVLARLKVRTQGRHLWMRTIGSTLVGEAIDSAVFYPLAFLGAWSPDLVLRVAITNYLIKVIVEVLFTPLTYFVVNTLKRIEGVDHFDRETDFNPLQLKV